MHIKNSAILADNVAIKARLRRFAIFSSIEIGRPLMKEVFGPTNSEDVADYSRAYLDRRPDNTWFLNRLNEIHLDEGRMVPASEFALHWLSGIDTSRSSMALVSFFYFPIFHTQRESLLETLVDQPDLIWRPGESIYFGEANIKAFLSVLDGVEAQMLRYDHPDADEKLIIEIAPKIPISDFYYPVLHAYTEILKYLELVSFLEKVTPESAVQLRRSAIDRVYEWDKHAYR